MKREKLSRPLRKVVGYNRRDRIRRLGRDLLRQRLESTYQDPEDDLEEKMLRYFKVMGWDDEPTWSQSNITIEEFKRRYECDEESTA